MAIQKKIQLYVSDTTGAAKTAKYYRIPLPADTMDYDILDNPLKGLVRLYCRIVGDRIEFAPVVHHLPVGQNTPGVKTEVITQPNGGSLYITHAEECSPTIPKELLNDGESYSGFMNLAMDDTADRVQFDTVSFFSNNNLTFPEGSESVKTALKYLDANKSKLFSKGNPIYSDYYSDLIPFVPSTWQEFESYEDVLTDIRNWIDGPDIVADRCPDYPKSMVNSPRLKYIITDVCTISGTSVDGEPKSGATTVEHSGAAEIYANYMERIKLDNPTLQGDTLSIECHNYYTNDDEARAKLSVFGKKANGDVVEFESTIEESGQFGRLYKATVTSVSEYTEILFHLYSRKNGGGQDVHTKVTFTV